MRHPNRNRSSRGFTMFEAIVAMFILLMGVLGVVAVFTSGMHTRMRAQEILMSQDLANQWADWVRFRLNPDAAGGSALSASGLKLTLADLSAGKKGDFNTGLSDAPFQVGAATALGNLPTVGASTTQGYSWVIADVADYAPLWVPEDGSDDKTWAQRLDGNALWSSADLGGATPLPLKRVDLTILRGARRYKFSYVFSGVGLNYD
ncbi:MAG: prepilin-type N-terminal cleavage/methylation domain-containing protein [Planctomycetota bacterium]|nr:prepilin-type N-terminal cleavage/methylation domain-containing protein [Planctomycetota bacterium]